MTLESISSGYTGYEKARLYIEGDGQLINSSDGSGFVEDSNGDKMNYFECMFSPSEFKEGYTTKWSEGNSQDQKTFLGYDRDALSLDIIFDSYQTAEGPQDVRNNRTSSINTYGLNNTSMANGKIYGVNQLKSLFKPTNNKQDGANKVPPTLIFAWGDFTYRGHMEKLNINYTMFLPNGIPVRAKVSLTLNAFMSQQESEDAIGKTACRKVRVKTQGLRLDTLAAQELKDATQWKRIARENGITDLLSFPQEADLGKTIIIPDLPKATT